MVLSFLFGMYCCITYIINFAAFAGIFEGRNLLETIWSALDFALSPITVPFAAGWLFMVHR